MDGSAKLSRFLDNLRRSGWENKEKCSILHKANGQCHTMVQVRMPQVRKCYAIKVGVARRTRKKVSKGEWQISYHGPGESAKVLSHRTGICSVKERHSYMVEESTVLHRLKWLQNTQDFKERQKVQNCLSELGFPG